MKMVFRIPFSQFNGSDDDDCDGYDNNHGYDDDDDGDDPNYIWTGSSLNSALI